jgi:twitching motility protein PilT
MVNLINNQREVHIVTIEDPIEILHQNNLAMIIKRECGWTPRLRLGLRAAMRQDPT